MSGRSLRVGGTLLVTALGVAYVVSQVDLSRTLRILAEASPLYVAAAFALTAGTVWPMAWRWRELLSAQGIAERVSWLARAYFVSYSAAQVLPTSLGGDAVRIVETSRRNPGSAGAIAGSVLLERALGGAATLTLAAVGLALALGRYDVGAYLWLELVLVLATLLLAVLFFARSARPLLHRSRPLLRRLRVERPARAVYEGIYAYRSPRRLLLAVFAVTLVVQALRILALWLTGKAVGVDVSPRVYFVMGPLLFLVMLVPFTINGLAVREAFFVSFLTNVDVSADAALATGFLFFLITVAMALPGAVIVAWQSMRGGARPRFRPGHG